MKNLKDELQDLIFRNESTGQGSQLQKHSVSLEEMRKQASQLKNSSASKVKKQQHS